MKNTLFTLCILLAMQLQAQDPHFSNYSNNSLGLNPALSGQINSYANRIQVSSRSQWHTVLGSDHFKTIQAAYDKRICSPLKGDFFGVGLNFLADERGQFPLQRTEGMLTASYIKLLSEKRSNRQSFLSLGAEGGFIHHQLGKEGLTFDNQFDAPSSAGEIFDKYNFTVLDYGAGLSFFTSTDDPVGYSLRLGVSASHLGKPAYAFMESGGEVEARLQTLYMFRAGATIPLSNRLAISVQAIFQDQSPFQQLYLSTGFIFGINSDTWFTLGTGWRQVGGESHTSTDAWVPFANFTKDWFQLNFSYDANISPLRQASKTTGAFELSATFFFGDNGCSRIFCPH